MSKYKNQKVELMGHTFDSKKEARRYVKLRTDEACGIISDLQMQVEFELIPKQELKKPRNVGKNGRCTYIELPVKYIADFTYRNASGEFVVEDVKSPITRTPEYILKRKLLLFLHGIQISEV